jgi:formylglycine-generating enzyme required for sulfatase activity
MTHLTTTPTSRFPRRPRLASPHLSSTAWRRSGVGIWLLLGGLGLGAMTAAQAQLAVSHVTVTQRPSSRVFEVDYSLSGGAVANVGLQVSADAGASWAVPVMHVAGDYGPAVPAGSSRKLIWDATSDWSGATTASLRFRVLADGRGGEMVMIPAGSFLMGDEIEELSNAPVHPVELSSFTISRGEVTKDQWNLIREWGLANGYSTLPTGGGKPGDHPVSQVTWQDAVRWCNARSEQEGLTPIYCTDATLTVPHKAGDYNPDNTWLRWEANGYRLPTEAEFEKAARGGVFGQRFPWGDLISHDNANFDNNGGEPYAVGTTGRHPVYSATDSPHSNPVHAFPANGYGVHGTQDNVWEWLWDRYSISYYTTSPLRDPLGPATGSNRSARGSSFYNGAEVAQLSRRRSHTRDYSRTWVGFRVARRSTLGAPVVAATSAAFQADLRPVAGMTLTGLRQFYDGTPRGVEAITQPAGLPVLITYEDSETPPSQEGSYQVQAVVQSAEYLGLTTATLVVERPRLQLENPPLTVREEGGAIVEMGYAAPGQLVQAVITLRNTGSGTLQQIEAALAGPDADLFQIVQMPDAELESGASTTCVVNLAPPTAGRFEVDLELVSSDHSHPLRRIRLAGHGDWRLAKSIRTPDLMAERPQALAVAWTEAALGTYSGLVETTADPAGVTVVGAIKNLRLSPPGRNSEAAAVVSGSLRVFGKTWPLRAALNPAGEMVTNFAATRSSPPLELTLSLTQTEAAAFRLTGSLTGPDDLRYAVDLIHAPFHRLDNPLPNEDAGRFTALFPSAAGSGQTSPGGDGWASLTVGSDGSVRLKGRLGDGTVFTESALLSAEGESPWFVSLYGGSGHFGGWVRFRQVPNISDCDGPLNWVKPAAQRAARYPAGFSVQSYAVGSRFQSTAPGQRLLASLADQEPNARLSLIDPALAGAVEGQVERVLGWLPNQRLRYFGPDQLSAQANSHDGTLTGSFRSVTERAGVALSGIVLQKQNLAAGYALLPRHTGALRIEPGILFPYPGSDPSGPPIRGEEPADTPLPPDLVNSPLLAAAAGTYEGVLNLLSTGTGGLENFRLKPDGSFTGQLWILGQKYALRGRFDVDGSATVQVQRQRGLSPLPLTLQLRQEVGSLLGFQLSGSVTVGGQLHQIRAQRQPDHSPRNRSPHEGRYTLAMLAPLFADPEQMPAGDSFAAFTVSHLGRCSGALVLADGSRTTFSGFVASSGEWSLHRPLYGKLPRGILAGKITFREVPGVSDADGEWHWSRQALAMPKSQFYPAGFAHTHQVVASRYQESAPGTATWPGLVPDWFNIWIHLAPAALQPGQGFTHLSRIATWDQRDRLHYFGLDSLTLTFARRTGIVTGTYRDPSLRLRQSMHGILLPAQGRVLGHYLTDGLTGRFSIANRHLAY